MMETDKILESFDISDYHRLQFLGDDISEILNIVLKNMVAGVGLFEVGESIRALYLNDAYYRCVGYSKEAYAGKVKDICSTLLEGYAEGFIECMRENAPKRKDIYYTVKGYREDGSVGWFDIKGVPLDNKVSEKPIYLTVVADISDKKEIEAQAARIKEANDRLLLEEERYKILEGTFQGILFEYWSNEDIMVFSYNFPDNKKRKEISNYREYIKKSPLVHSSHIEMFKKALFDACESENEGTIEYLSLVSGGGYRWHNTYYKSVVDADGKVVSVIGKIKDIHERKMEQEMLNHKADLDELTSLYRKESAFEKMQECIEQAPAGEFYFTILDLDDFKEINDKFGHIYGDKVLKQVADALMQLFGDSSVIGRFGGDEFMLLSRDLGSDEVISNLESMKNQFKFCAGMVTVRTGADIKETFDMADKAMYNVKRAGKNDICFI